MTLHRPFERAHLLLHGLLIGAVGVPLQLLAAVLAAWALLVPEQAAPTAVAWTVVLGGGATLLGALLAAIDLFVLLPGKRRLDAVRLEPPARRELTVALTAYNDEMSIGQAVKDFLTHPAVKRVVVVDNGSCDATAKVAAAAGAIVVTESRPGYGACVFRALGEGAAHQDTDLVLLCEGDCTFHAFDVEKFLAYIPHADIVNGTRIVEQLRSPQTQLTTFMYYGNFFVGKLLEAKHLGAGTFTDIGTTYKLCRKSAVERLLPRLNRSVNLEFNAHLLDAALEAGLQVVECPITFFPRVGESKGGNVDNWRAFCVGLRMMRGLLFGWPAGH